jgi:ankyrin repeat protein
MKIPFYIVLFFCITIFTFPIFGQYKRDLTNELRDALSNNNVTTTESLLKEGADPNGIFGKYGGDEKETFLMRAVYVFRGVELTKLLLDYGADPNVRDSKGNTAAHYADDATSKEIFRLLAAKGARFDITNNQRVSPLMRQVKRGEDIAGVVFLLDWEESNNPGFTASYQNRKVYYTAIIAELLDRYSSRHISAIYPLMERLLKAGADPNGISDDETFLTKAIKDSKNRLAGLLLDYGADLEARNKYGRTAAFYGDNEGAALLDSRGAHFDITDKDGASPLSVDYYLHSPQRAVYILEWEEKNTPDFSAMLENRKNYLTHILAQVLGRDNSHDGISVIYTLVERLLERGANPAATQPNGSLIASLAVKQSSLSIIPLLIEHGVPLDTFNKNGKAILYIATEAKNIDLIKYLLNKRADPNQQSNSGETPLMIACSGLTSTIASVQELAPAMELLNAGVNLNLQDNKGETALIKTRNKQLAKMLLNAGADPTIKNFQGQTVLHRWLRFLDGPLLDDLISNDCYIDEPDNDGTTMLMIAVRNEYRSFVPVALDRGADPNLCDSKGRTSLHQYLLSVENSNKHSYQKDDYESITEMLLAAGARPTIMDYNGDSALNTAMRLSKRYKEMAPLQELMQQYASADEIKAAQSAASKIISKEKRSGSLYNFTDGLTTALYTFGFSMVVSGLSIGMREGVYRNNPSNNFMGPVNSVLGFTMGGMALGALILSPLAAGGGWDNLIPIVGGFVGGFIGLFGGIIITAVAPSITRAFNNNPILYYAPSVVGTLASLLIFSLRFK